MPTRPRLVVIALGGNAILQPGQRGTFEEQQFNIDMSCRSIAELIVGGTQVIVSHGNGPQVGNILIQNSTASTSVPAMPMDACSAESQGLIGYMMQQSLRNHLRRTKHPALVVTLVTETEVDLSDVAFAAPSKPVGPFYSAKRARGLAVEKGFVVREDAGRGWRRVVPSPLPQRIVQSDAVKVLLATGALVICCGGGGVPVVRDETGAVHGVEAVIDKDLSAAVLASDVGADLLVMLTDVPNAYLDYGGEHQRALKTVSTVELYRHQCDGQFADGSMGPKVEAALRFARRGGVSVIAGQQDLSQAVAGRAGTHVSLPSIESPWTPRATHARGSSASNVTLD